METIRRCGKSYLLNTIFYHHLLNSGVDEDHIIHFAFDSAEDLSLMGESLIKMEKQGRRADPEKFMAYIRSQITDKGMYYLLLDEVQMLDCFEAVLNGYLRKDHMDVYVTGSNARFLSKDIITEFAGRGDEIRMYPLSFAEFMSVYQGDRYEGLSEYMLYGGIPLVVLRKESQDKASMLENLFSEIYIRDKLRMRGYRVDVGVVPVLEKDPAGKVIRRQLEVDFVCNLASARYYIQSAYSIPDEGKRKQEIRPFRKIDDSFKKMVITRDPIPTHYDEYGILTLNVYDFLFNPEEFLGAY